MIHNGHCFHCGRPMAVGSQECNNVLCRMDEQARPVWPWSRCADDEAVALFCMSFRSGLLWLLLPALGILLFIVGNIFVSGRLIDIGLVCISCWFLSRYLLYFIRNANTALFIHEQSRHQAQERHDAGLPHTDTPGSRKKLDDEYDHVEHDQWAVRGYKWLKLTINLATALLIMLFIVSWGPGNIFHWNIKNWTHDKIEKVINNPIVDGVKRELNWDNNRLKYLENVLRGERGLTFEQFQYILSSKDFHFNVDKVFNILKSTDLQGDELYRDIYNRMQLPAVTPPSTKVQTTKGFGQKAREHLHTAREIYWQILFWMNVLLILFVAVSFILMPISFAVAKGTMFADEIGDIVKQKIEEYEERRRVKTGAQPTQPQPVATRREEPEEERRHGIVSIGIISLVTDLIFDKLLRKFFQ